MIALELRCRYFVVCPCYRRSDEVVRIISDTLAYFRELAEGVAIPYQTLINMYLRDCAAKRKQLRLDRRPSKS